MVLKKQIQTNFVSIMCEKRPQSQMTRSTLKTIAQSASLHDTRHAGRQANPTNLVMIEIS